ncbi:MAG: hypothetical protein MPW14_18105 [Candidatus Manganitrophus sp.]|nr:MAG: hypothetical protein MPW14_18105 [Candidatus Manganitrophus sp.]
MYSSLTDSSADIPGKIFLELTPLPEKITVGQQYQAGLQVSVDGWDDEAPVAGSFDYRDRSPAPLKHLPLGDPDPPGFRALQGFSPLPAQGAFVLDGIGSYLCEAAAPAAIFSLDVRPALETSGRFLTPDLLITFRTTHTCAAPTLLPAPEAEVITVPFSQPEAIFNLSRAIPPPFLSLFGLDENRAYATVGHHLGMSILDLTTNRVVLTKALEPDGLGPLLGTVAHLRDGRGCLFGYRERRFLSCRIPEINDFGPPESSDDGPYHDAGLVSETPVETPSGTRHLLWFVEADRVHQEHQPGGSGSLIFERKLERAWFATGGTPTGNAKSAFFTGGGARMLAVVARGEPSGPGQLWWGNPAELGGGNFRRDAGERHAEDPLRDSDLRGEPFRRPGHDPGLGWDHRAADHRRDSGDNQRGRHRCAGGGRRSGDSLDRFRQQQLDLDPSRSNRPDPLLRHATGPGRLHESGACPLRDRSANRPALRRPLVQRGERGGTERDREDPIAMSSRAIFPRISKRGRGRVDPGRGHDVNMNPYGVIPPAYIPPPAPPVPESPNPPSGLPPCGPPVPVSPPDSPPGGVPAP